MAVFMINICKFNGCGITFPRLADLIEHIEDVHIDYDPAVIEQKEASQPACIPLSYVLRFFTEASRREFQSLPPAADVRRRILSAPKTPSVRSSTPTGSEVDDDELMSPSEDSNDSWTTVEEYSSEFILRYGVKMNANATSGALGPAAQEKPFACPVPGCKKRYKNVNGIKYHSKNGHKKDGKKYPVLPNDHYKQRITAPKKRLTAQEYFWKKWGKKAYKCQCGKSYKTAQGLKSHSITQHIATSQASTSSVLPPTPTPPTPDTGRLHAPKMPGLVVTASPAHSRSLNIIDGLDANKLVRIYDSIKTKDLPSFTIPKHNLTNLNLIAANQNQSVRHSVLLTPNSSPIDKSKYDRTPKVTVNQQPPATISSSYDA